MYNFPFGGVATTLTAAMALVGGFLLAAKKVIAKLKSKVATSAIQAMGSAPPNRGVKAAGMTGLAGLSLLKGLPKKRGWWKDLLSSAVGGLKTKWNRIRRRKKEDDKK